MTHLASPSRSALRSERCSATRLLVWWVGGLAASGLAMPALAEPMFVIDKVVLNVYAEPNQQAGKVATLETGDTVEVIDELEPYVQVRLPDAREGWVKASYLTRQPPAILRLKELQGGQPAPPTSPPPQLLQELEELRKQKSALEGALIKLKDEIAMPSTALPTHAAAKPEPTAKAVSPIAVPQPEATKNRFWAWFAATVSAGGLGFLLGYQTLAARIKLKYGNIKIY